MCLSYSFITTMLGTFMYVRNRARRLHRNKTPSLLFKLDIWKAFDSVHWEIYLTFCSGGASLADFRIGLPPSLALLYRGSFSMGCRALRLRMARVLDIAAAFRHCHRPAATNSRLGHEAWPPP